MGDSFGALYIFMLAAIAGQTERIRLGSAVTVLSSDDPVRVFERFSTLDAVSNGRAEVILGRGSFIESFPLFGFPLDRYEQLFEEKLALFVELLLWGKAEGYTWFNLGMAPLWGLENHPLAPAWHRVGNFVFRHGEHFYNFWQDAEHPRGLWRRTSLAGYAQAQPEWDVVLDLDAEAARAQRMLDACTVKEAA